VLFVIAAHYLRFFLLSSLPWLLFFRRFFRLPLIEVVPVTSHCALARLGAVNFVDQFSSIIMVGCVFVMTQILEESKTRLSVIANLFDLCFVNNIVCVESVISWVSGSLNKSLRVRMELFEVFNVDHRGEL
jgi:hypothetical protein